MTDLLVVGGGPIGLAVAIRASAAGLSVRVLDARKPPLDKACGEGIMPDGVELLERLGVDPVDLAGQPFGGIRYLDGDDHAEGRFSGRRGLGVRRTRLHSVMRERAERVGVDPYNTLIDRVPGDNVREAPGSG